MHCLPTLDAFEPALGCQFCKVLKQFRRKVVRVRDQLHRDWLFAVDFVLMPLPLGCLKRNAIGLPGFLAILQSDPDVAMAHAALRRQLAKGRTT